MSRREYVCQTAEETEKVGRALGQGLRGGEVVLLFGPLGAGKTQFVRGMAAGLGHDPAAVSSPSYALITCITSTCTASRRPTCLTSGSRTSTGGATSW